MEWPENPTLADLVAIEREMIEKLHAVMAVPNMKKPDPSTEKTR